MDNKPARQLYDKLGYHRKKESNFQDEATVFLEKKLIVDGQK
jgi:hypothetical protein